MGFRQAQGFQQKQGLESDSNLIGLASCFEKQSCTIGFQFLKLLSVSFLTSKRTGLVQKWGILKICEFNGDGDQLGDFGIRYFQTNQDVPVPVLCLCSLAPECTTCTQISLSVAFLFCICWLCGVSESSDSYHKINIRCLT